MVSLVYPEPGQKAALFVINHLRNYGPNARVLILAPDAKAIIQVCTDGPEGLFTNYGEEFIGAVVNENMRQFNHEKGGQVQGLTTEDVAKGRHNGQVFTLIWAENMTDGVGPNAVEECKRGLRTNAFVSSLAGITV